MLEDHERALTTCTYCPSMCRHVCPVGTAEGREAVTPQAKMAMLGRLRSGSEAWSQESASVLYACNGCGLCTRACAHEIDVTSALMAGRVAAVARSSGHAALADLPARFFARASRRRETLHARFEGRLASGGELAYLPGCGSWRDDGSSVARDLAVIGRFGLGELPVADFPFACAGYALWAGGHEADLLRVATATQAAVSGYGALVTSCPACTWMLRETYPRLGLVSSLRILHSSEMLAGRLDSVRMVRRRGRAFYQEACMLGRHLGIRDAPRRLAAACVEELVEPHGLSQLAPCSGGGGLVPLTAPETAARTAARRVDEAIEARARLVIAACPTAARTLAVGRRRIPVVALMDLLAAAARSV